MGNAFNKSPNDQEHSYDRGRNGHETASIEPMRWKTAQPEREANFFSLLLFLWVQPLFSRAAYLQKHGLVLQQEDLAPLTPHDRSSYIMERRFNRAWKSYHPTKTTRKGGQGKDSDGDEYLQSRLRHALWGVVGRRFIISGIVKFFNSILQFSFPLLLNAILRFLEETEEGEVTVDAIGGLRYKGYLLSSLLFLAIASKAVTDSTYFHYINRCGWTCKAAISAAVYSKSLCLANAALHGTTLGEMVNLMQVDAAKIQAFMPQAHVLWDGVLQIAGYVAILGTLLGWPCLTGLFVMMFAIPVLNIVCRKLLGQNRTMVKFTDERVKSTNEALQGIRSVKMYTWESSFAKQIGKSREDELACLKTVAYLRAFSRAYVTALPTVAAVCTFLVYTYVTDGEISASTLFASLVAFDQLRLPLLYYPLSLANLAQAKVSLGRVSKFLGLAEISNEGYTRVEEGDGEVEIKNATIYWTDPEIPISDHGSQVKASVSEKWKSYGSVQETNSERANLLAQELVYPEPVVQNISLKVAPGELCAIVGRVGSGKSSLCSAVLNETCLGEGSEITVRGRKIAYCAQSAWILNKTIRENILFGLPYEEGKYNKVVEVCQLQHDLEMLDDGDATEIGEQGINLSGGQKQRVALARAAYADADLIIFDDPLSALDPEVAGKAFEQCILGFLRGKTRILVTNQLQCLPKCDTVVALGKGRVLEQGTFSDLMKDSSGEVQRIIRDLQAAAEKETDALGEKASIAAGEGAPGQKSTTGTDSGACERSKEAKTLITKEEREVGAVKMKVYLKYLQSGGGLLPFAFVYSMYIASATVSLLSTAWVSIWTSDPTYERNSKSFYMGYYSLTAVLLGVVTFMRSYLLAKFGVRASFKLHEKLLDSVLHATMSFFDTTPTGRILTRFSSDLFSVDQELTDFFDIFLFLSLNVLVTMGAIVFVTPWFGVALVPLGHIYFGVLNYFRQVSRETKRLESLSRSPVYAQFSETLGGLSTIRAYHACNEFVSQFETLLDASTQASYNNRSAGRWLSTRLEMLGAAVAGLAAIFAIHVVISGASAENPQNNKFAPLAGLSLTYAIGVTGSLQFVVRTLAQVEAAMNSCERVLYYSESVPLEAPSTAHELEKLVARSLDQSTKTREPSPPFAAVTAAGGKAVHPPPEWPSKGEIILTQLVMRYREETPLVLKGLNVNIGAGTRIGVVGRTGSGKSSLLLCLLRIVEPELQHGASQYQPPITIDGVDILRIGLRELRSKIGIIPQSPVLFSGTIRSNLDPFDEYTDDQIYDALQKCGMHEAVMAMQGELFAPVSEYGENLSQGQRQLLCLGRALLRNCKVLLLDEATSSVDFETDREIQRTLREAFAGCTVLTIAHRVDTITDSDFILVMKDGVAGEFGPPEELLQDGNSLFADIVRHNGNHKS